MQLVKPTFRYEKSWLAAINEFQSEGKGGFWNVPEKPTALVEYIERTEAHSKGLNLPDYWVPATTYWLIDNEEMVGHVNVREKLTAKLEKVGGHIGYAIRRSARKRGYGYKILELALPKAKAVGLPKAMLTCDDANTASWKIIERHHGRLIDIGDVNGELVRRYWIDLQ